MPNFCLASGSYDAVFDSATVAHTPHSLTQTERILFSTARDESLSERIKPGVFARNFSSPAA